MSLLQAQDLSLSLSGRAVLQSVNVSAQGGEFIAVIGPNGAGKSTLLTVLAGLLTPDRGVVQLDGRKLSAYAPRELAQRRAFLPQNPRCDWPLPVERMVALGLTPGLSTLGRSTPDDQRRIAAALADCDLTARRAQAVTTLSGGELARAMLARALVGDPEILIVDEPIAGLDPRHALDAMRRLSLLARTQQRLVIAAVHDLTLAMRHATRLWALHEGCLLADGSPEAVLTPQLLRELFDVAACVSGQGSSAYVDYA